MNKINKVENRGGSGRNQGRKLKYGETTIKVNYRVPKSLKSELDEYVSFCLSKYVKIKNNQQNNVKQNTK